MVKVTRQFFTDFYTSILNSYAQVFFSVNKVFAAILIIVSFFDVYAGIAGLLAVILSNGIAMVLGMRRQTIISGAYGFNALLVGLGIGIYYQPGVEFYLILFFISLFTLLVTISLEGVIGKYGLPYLSLPFLVGIWVVVIALRGYSELEMSERGVYNLNDMFAIGGMTMVNVYEWFNNLAIPEPIRIYFKSLSAILFQYHIFAGILLSIGLIYYSRIAFLLSIIGFFSAYYFYLFIGASISELSYSYIGFNYILTAIAIGGYFIVPSKRSVIWVVILTPIVAIVLSSTAVLFATFQLSIFSLPFNIVVILFLYALKLRETNFNEIVTVNQQLNSPELHAYSNYSFLKRFSLLPVFSMKLPLWGSWNVTQAYDGEITHKDNWKYAWDFEIFDDEGKSYGKGGDSPEDYYCYNKPVVAPSDGTIVEIDSDIFDNQIGKVDLENNWGNSIVIKHADHFYCQLSHLKKDSIQVTVGQTVKQGELMAYVGNSGRSPYPHLHMQFQSNPSIGSETIDYPFSSLVIDRSNEIMFETVSRPLKGDNVSNLLVDDILVDAFSFTPGSELVFEVERSGRKIETSWVSETNISNSSYLLCKDTGDKLWFNSIGDVYYSTYYEGGRSSLLYYFYLSTFKLAMADKKSIIVHDSYPLNIFPNKILLTLQDFAIPFFKFLSADFKASFVSNNKSQNKDKRFIESYARFSIGNTEIEKNDFLITIGEVGIEKIEVSGKNNITATRKL